MKRQKIIYMVNHIDWFWSHRLPLAKGAVEAGYDVSILVTGADQQQDQFAEHGLRGIELPAIGQGLGPLSVFKTIKNIHDILKDEKPDIFHVITIKYAFLAGLAAWLHPRLCVVHLIAGLGYLFSGNDTKSKILRVLVYPLLRMALRRKGTEVIFQNPDDQAIMLGDGLVSKDHIHLIRGSGVDTHHFKPREMPQSDPPIVIMPTRLVHDKGISVFVDAARLLQDRGAAVEMQIAGGITAYNPLAITESEMTEMIADGAATWLGKVDDMPDLLAKATLIAYPSHYREGIPKVLLEACAMAKPIVTTDHPGCREAVRSGYNGLLVPVKDAHALAAAIEALLADQNLREKMAKNSRLRAEREFDATIVTRETLAIYSHFDEV